MRGWVVPTNADLRLPCAYKTRLEPAYYEDVSPSLAGGVWQPEVYPFAAALAERMCVPTLVDIGCGHGERIAEYSRSIRTLGIDFGQNIRHARQARPDLEWLELDLAATPDALLGVAKESLVIFSDVVEHLVNPLPVLNVFRILLPQIYGIVISTPDRDRARGAEDPGPPANSAHTMEWGYQEFSALLNSSGLRPLVHGHTRNFSGAATRNTQVAFIPGGLSRVAHVKRVSAIAFVPCFNEVDVITHTVDRLLLQGLSVHVLDNWSTDGSWQLMGERYGSANEVHLERFPTEPRRHYEWAAILDRIDDLAAHAPQDWILHVDADEQVDSFSPDLSLIETLGMADAAGYDVLDCTLIDFRPESQSSPCHSPSALPARWQFAKRPGAKHLERAWKRRGGPVGLSSAGGHLLNAPKRVFPFNLVLRHYPLPNPQQARRKVFTDRLPRVGYERSQRGWHVQYDCFPSDAQFLWRREALYDWNWYTPREWVAEFCSRAGLEFTDFKLPEGFY